MLMSIVASKVMLAPLALVNFSVMWLSMLLSVNTVLSMLRTASLKVIVMLLLMAPGCSVSRTECHCRRHVVSVPPPVSVPVPGTCIRVIPKLRLLVFAPMEKLCDSP